MEGSRERNGFAFERSSRGRFEVSLLTSEQLPFPADFCVVACRFLSDAEVHRRCILVISFSADSLVHRLNSSFHS